MGLACPMQNATLTLVRGDDQDVGVTVRNPDGSAYNLTDCTLTLTVRQNTYFSPVVLAKSVTQHLDPTNGSSQISFVPAETEGMDESTRYFDIRLTAGGKVKTLAYGPFLVRPRG